MNAKINALYFWIVALSFAGLVVAYYLIPSSEEIALLEFESGKFLKAKKYYQEQYDRGNRTADVVIALSKINEQQGDLQTSISLMREYVHMHPGDVKALRRLGDLYQLSQQYQEYFQVLLQIQKKEKETDPEVLKEIAGWYQNKNAAELWSITLNELIKTGKAQSDDYLNLAYLYASEKKYEEAYSLLETRRLFFSKNVSLDELLFGLWLTDQMKKSNRENKQYEQQAIDALTEFLIREKNPQLVKIVLAIVSDKYPDYFPEMALHVQPMIQGNVLLENKILYYQWQNPNARESLYPQLVQIIRKGMLDAETQNFAFDIIIDQDNEELFLDLIQKSPAQNIEQRSIINLCVLALERRKPNFAKEMQEALGKRYLKKNPAIAISLQIAAKEAGARENLKDLLKVKPLIQTDRYYLLRLAGAAGYQEEVLSIGRGLFPFIGFQDFELLNIATAYIHVKKAEDLVVLLKDASSKIGTQQTEVPLIFLDIYFGRSKKVADWIQSRTFIKEYVLSQFFSMAQEKKEYPLALFIAKRAFRDFPSRSTQLNYAFTLVQVGKIEHGMALLENIYATNPNDTQAAKIYFSGLALAAKKSSLYHNQISSFMQEQEAKGGLPRELMVDFGYVYLDVLHDFAKAEKIFWNLSKNAAADSPDVQTLVFLWGPNPSASQLEWLEEKAENSDSEDLGIWLEYLIYTGDYDFVIHLFKTKCYQGLEVDSYFAYMDALAAKKQKKDLREAIDLIGDRAHGKKQLEKLAYYAEEAGYLKVRKEIWKKFVENWPDDPVAWQNLARVNFEERDYEQLGANMEKFLQLCCPLKAQYYVRGVCNAACSLKKCLDNTSSTCGASNKLALSLYEYSESLQKRWESKEAKAFLNLALERLDQEKKSSLTALETKALILYKLGKRQDASALMQQLYEMSGRDPDVAASYANFMMDDGHLHQARRFLEKALGHSLEEGRDCKPSAQTLSTEKDEP